MANLTFHVQALSEVTSCIWKQDRLTPVDNMFCGNNHRLSLCTCTMLSHEQMKHQPPAKSASMPACQDTAGCSRGESHGKILFVSGKKGCDTLTRTEPNEARFHLCRLNQMDGLKQDLYLRYTAFHRRFPIAVHNLIVWQQRNLPPSVKQQHNVEPECATLLNAMIPA